MSKTQTQTQTQTQREIAVSAEARQERWYRHRVRIAVRLVSIGPRLSGISSRSAELIEISRGTAVIDASTATGLSEHYYLDLPGIAERIGCAEIARRQERLFVRFIRPLDRMTLSDLLLDGQASATAAVAFAAPLLQPAPLRA